MTTSKLEWVRPGRQKQPVRGSEAAGTGSLVPPGLTRRPMGQGGPGSGELKEVRRERGKYTSRGTTGGTTVLHLFTELTEATATLSRASDAAPRPTIPPPSSGETPKAGAKNKEAERHSPELGSRSSFLRPRG